MKKILITIFLFLPPFLVVHFLTMRDFKNMCPENYQWNWMGGQCMWTLADMTGISSVSCKEDKCFDQNGNELETSIGDFDGNGTKERKINFGTIQLGIKK